MGFIDNYLEKDIDFGAEGWADGYADMESNHENILNQLYGKIPDSELVDIINSYLNGYEVGSFMSHNADEIYDEDGILKEDEYDIDSTSHFNEAETLVMRERLFQNSSIISLEDYKKELIDYYKNEIDNNEVSKAKRKELLEKNYSDTYLTKIIEDTYIIIKDILECPNDYMIIDMYDDTRSLISLGLSGGWFADEIIIDNEGHAISSRILRRVLGNNFLFYVDSEEYSYEADDDDDICLMSVDYRYFLYMQNMPDNKDEIYQNLFGNQKTK